MMNDKKKTLLVLPCFLGYILYFVGAVSIGIKANLIPYGIGAIIFGIAVFGPVIAMISTLKIFDWENNDTSLIYFASGAFVAIIAGYGLFSVLSYINTPNILCWILSIVLAVYMFIFTPTK